MEEGKQKKLSNLNRRLILFPLPLQGHSTPMFHLATLLHSQGFSITIIHTRYNSPDPTGFPHLTFHFIDDGLAENPMSDLSSSFTTLRALNTSCLEPFRTCLARILCYDVVDQDQVASLISDPMWEFTGAVADSFKLPRIVLRTSSMSAFVVYDSLPGLRERGFFPVQDTKLDEPLLELPPLKLKDLPSESLHNMLVDLVKETGTSQGVICNTFEELEVSAISRVQEALHIPIFPVGPLHKCSQTSAGSIWAQDQTSISWLNTQAPKSVLYVSFGSVVSISEEEFLEIAWGLANSMKPFLWVIRPRLIEGSSEEKDQLPEGFMNMVGERGHIVKWAPQQEVLAHPAIGGFWTHCGWNSTLESIADGVPMICLPFFADQVITARYISDEWKIGMKLERGMRREEIEKAITKLMVGDEAEDMRRKIATLKEKASSCLVEGGSSHKSLEMLTNYLLSF